MASDLNFTTGIDINKMLEEEIRRQKRKDKINKIFNKTW
jgi:hypothetical protein